MKKLCKDYESALELLKSRQSLKVGNNTYLKRLDTNTIALQLHDTYVLMYRVDGTVQLNSGGFKTNTTKKRLNDYSNVVVRQVKGVWSANGAPFNDFMVFYNNAVVHSFLGDNGLIEFCNMEGN